MQQSFDVLFASSNKNKFIEAKKILADFGIKLEFFKCDLQEIQSDSIQDIASEKVVDAYKKCKKPVIIEDDGLFIKSLYGFPGPFSSYVFKTIGNKGILELMKKNRSADFRSTIAYCDKNNFMLFNASVKGKISKKIIGKGWGYDPIFVLNNKEKTFAQLTDKNSISHRYKALKKFSNWFLHMEKSSVQ